MSMGASLSEARELYAILEDIEKKLTEINARSGARSTPEASIKLMELRINLLECYTLAQRMFVLVRKISPNEDFNEAIMEIQRFISTLNTLRITIMLLETASGPVGWALAGIGLVTTFLSMFENVEREFRRGMH